MDSGYTIGELAGLSGVSVRALRFYEEEGLLTPAREAANGYRRYTSKDVDRLQEIMLLRHLGVAVRDIGPLLSTSAYERRHALSRHLVKLRAERDRLVELIKTVERTLAHLEGETDMTDTEKFEGFKHELVEDNERRYGDEARERYGDAAVDESNRKMLNMSKNDFEAWRALETEILDALAEAVREGEDPAGPLGAHVCELHRRWLGYTWPSYSPEAHRGLAEGYVADERFRAYYDRVMPGATDWLRDAILAHAGM